MGWHPRTRVNKTGMTWQATTILLLRQVQVIYTSEKYVFQIHGSLLLGRPMVNNKFTFLLSPPEMGFFNVLRLQKERFYPFSATLDIYKCLHFDTAQMLNNLHLHSDPTLVYYLIAW